MHCASLRSQCVKFGLPKTGKHPITGKQGKGKAVLITALNGPRPPAHWLKRKKAKLYNPSGVTSAATALLVTLFLHESEKLRSGSAIGDGLEHSVLSDKAASLEIKKNCWAGGTTQNPRPGQQLRTGMTSMNELLASDKSRHTSAPPPLCYVVQKGTRRYYKLSRNHEFDGIKLAEDMHEWCHEWGRCKCGRR